MVPKVILITGASTGFGRELVDAVLAQGDIAVATLRKPEVLDTLASQYGKDRLLVLKVDVTKTDEVSAAFDKVTEVYGRLDVVISNAGFSAIGEAEATSEKLARDMFDVNYFGAVEVSKQAVRFFRDVNPTPGGYFFNISSVSGISSLPGTATYVATKHAIEGYVESLKGELDPAWNIRITSICPSLFRTSVINNSPTIDPHLAYTNPTLATNQVRAMIQPTPENKGLFGDDPKKAAKAILGLVDREGPAPVRVPMGEWALAGFGKKSQELKEQAEEFDELARSMAFAEGE